MSKQKHAPKRQVTSEEVIYATASLAQNSSYRDYSRHDAGVPDLRKIAVRLTQDHSDQEGVIFTPHLVAEILGSIDTLRYFS